MLDHMKNRYEQKVIHILKHDLKTNIQEAEKTPPLKIHVNRHINVHVGRKINIEVLISLNRIPTSSDNHQEGHHRRKKATSLAKRRNSL